MSYPVAGYRVKFLQWVCPKRCPEEVFYPVARYRVKGL